MIKANISKEHHQEAEKLRYSHPILVVRRRMAVIFFKGLNRCHKEIAELAGVSSTSVTTILRIYEKGGLQAVESVSHRTPTSELDKHAELVLNHFNEFPPSTAKEAKEKIEQLTHIKRNVSRIKVFLHKLGMKPRKTAALPAKVDPVAQEDFKKKYWSLS